MKNAEDTFRPEFFQETAVIFKFSKTHRPLKIYFIREEIECDLPFFFGSPLLRDDVQARDR